jgi:predicted membrane-bound spermidine synthase
MGLARVAKVVPALAGAALNFFGVAFLGAAIALVLEPRLGVAGSAAATGLILLLPPCIWGVATAFRSPDSLPRHSEPTVENAFVTLLTRLVYEKPLLAVLGAALFGAPQVLLRRKK